MKNLLTILFFAFLTTATFARGGGGYYYIKGTAYGTESLILRNAELTVKIGKDTTTIKTDGNGQFEIKVLWQTACPSGMPLTDRKELMKQENVRLNPKYIYIKYKGKEIKFKNEWEKYAIVFSKEKDKVTMKKDFHFVAV